MRRLLRWIVRAGLVVVALVVAYVVGSLAWVRTLEKSAAISAAPGNGEFVDAGGTPVHWQAFGAYGRPVVLLVHGTAAWSGTWFSLVPALENAGYQVVALDLPPFGFSGKSIDADFSREAQAERIRAVLDDAGIDRVTVVGHSFGGGPALEFALRHPDRVQRLVLVDAALGLQAAPPDPASLACRVLATPMLRDPLIASTAAQPLFSRALLRSFVARKEAVTDTRLLAYRRPAHVQGASAAMGAWAHHFACVAETGSSTDPAAIGRLQPALDILWGADDTVTPLAQGKHLQSLVPHSRLQVIQGVGHIPHIEDPLRFEQVLLATLARAPGDAAP
ncbi:MAG: alpha/beta fold hydrolase [Arenimonas sp.]